MNYDHDVEAIKEMNGKTRLLAWLVLVLLLAAWAISLRFGVA